MVSYVDNVATIVLVSQSEKTSCYKHDRPFECYWVYKLWQVFIIQIKCHFLRSLLSLVQFCEIARKSFIISKRICTTTRPLIGIMHQLMTKPHVKNQIFIYRISAVHFSEFVKYSIYYQYSFVDYFPHFVTINVNKSYVSFIFGPL